MKATPTGSWVRIETGITPSHVADLFRDWTAAVADASRARSNKQLTDSDRRRYDDIARSYAADLHEALNPRLTVGQARAFGWETVNAATSAAREAWNEEGVAG